MDSTNGTKCCIKRGVPVDCLSFCKSEQQIALNLTLSLSDIENGNPLEDILMCSKHADDIRKCKGNFFLV